MAWQRKEADARYNAKRYESHLLLRAEVLKNLGNECYVCGAGGCKLDLHHVEYHESESAYPRNGSGWSRIARVREAHAHPERFRLLCPSCHEVVTHIGEAKPKMNLLRLAELIFR